MPSFEAVYRAGESAKTFQALFSHAAECTGASPLERPGSRPRNKLKMKNVKCKSEAETTFLIKSGSAAFLLHF